MRGERKIYEWAPGMWWAVEETGKDGSLTPLYHLPRVVPIAPGSDRHRGTTPEERKAAAEAWLAANPKTPGGAA